MKSIQVLWTTGCRTLENLVELLRGAAAGLKTHLDSGSAVSSTLTLQAAASCSTTVRQPGGGSGWEELLASSACQRISSDTQMSKGN